MTSAANGADPLPGDILADRGHNTAAEVCAALNGLLADAFALYFKTKNFHWHVRGSHFRDYHLLFDEQAQQILQITDALAERVRKLGCSTLKSLQQAASTARIRPNEAESVPAGAMIAELMGDNRCFLETLRDAHAIADHHEDVGTVSLLENWIDEAEGRLWFLREAADA